MKNILIVSPIPFSPNWEGNRKRVEQITNLFLSKGDKVHFLYINHAKGNENEMKNQINGNFYSLEDKKAKSYKQPWYLRTLISKATKIYSLCNLPIDSWYFNEIGIKVNEIVKENKIDVVVCEYIFYTKCLSGLKNIIKIIDTHDIFSDRYKVFLEMNRRPQWFSTSPKNEARAINRCDIAIAIQPDDENYFKSISNKKIITLPFAPPPSKINNRKKIDLLKICFIGSSNDVNVSAINTFLDEIFPEIIEENLQLTIAGSVANYINSNIKNKKNIVLIEKVEDLEAFFSSHDVLINPTKTGTGLPIKVLEALANGLHVIGSKSGIRGIQNIEPMNSIHTCETAEEWRKKIATLIELKTQTDISSIAYKDYNSIYNNKLLSENKLISEINKLHDNLPRNR